MKWTYLAIAIIFETIATTFLKSTNGFKNLIPSIIVVIGYSIAFYFLSLSLKQLPVGIAYAIWSGMGVVLIALFGSIFYKQQLDIAAIVGMILIIIGVIIMNVFSKSIAH